MLVLLGGACSHRTASCSSLAAACHADIAASAASFGPASEAAGQAAELAAGPAAEPAADRPIEPPILFLSLHWGHHIPAQLVETLLTNAGRGIPLPCCQSHALSPTVAVLCCQDWVATSHWPICWLWHYQNEESIFLQYWFFSLPPC